MDPHNTPEPSHPEDNKKEITITVTVGKHVNLAMQQNSVPIIRELIIRNPGDSVLQDIEICVESDPAFMRPHSVSVPLFL
ncbi:MAG: hypothetical protein KQH63_21735 [Desulfobulbaceae bacterium]|nr:hypothetical protein [Desulfobulbaceae bacterium]